MSTLLLNTPTLRTLEKCGASQEECRVGLRIHSCASFSFADGSASPPFFRFMLETFSSLAARFQSPGSFNGLQSIETIIGNGPLYVIVAGRSKVSTYTAVSLILRIDSVDLFSLTSMSKPAGGDHGSRLGLE